MAWLRKNLAIDLGTTNILVYTRAEGIKFQEPSVVALDLYTDAMVAVGEEAKNMLGRTPGNIVARHPLHSGVVADYRATEKMLGAFLHRAVEKSLLHPDVMISVPSRATQVQKRAITQAATAGGAHEAYLIEAPLAAALGAGVEVSDPRGTLIVDVGGGLTDVALISLGGIVVAESTTTAGNAFDEAVARYILDQHQVMIGEQTAEEIKLRLGSVLALDAPERVEVKGRHRANGLPVRVYMTRNDLDEALAPQFRNIAETVHRVLAQTPPELSSDLFDQGILLSGGGSLVRGLGECIQKRCGIRVNYVEQPISAVVRGTGKALTWIRRMRASDDLLADKTRQQVMNREILRKR